MKGPMVEPLQIDRRKLFEQVAAHLERQIVQGQLKPGERLPPERDLQKLFGVGRPAIREALIALQRAGLVELSNGTRARVAAPNASGVLAGLRPAALRMLGTPEGQRHFQDLRLFVEAGLARQAARTASAADFERLEAALRANEAAVADPERFVVTDVALHYVLAEMTGNPILAAMHDAMLGWLREQRAVSITLPGQRQKGVEAHRAVAARDPDCAEAAMRDHLTQVADAYWRAQSGAG